MLGGLFKRDKDETPMSELDGDDHVFLVSPCKRSGTNFLYNMLIKTKICRYPQSDLTKGEDYILYFSNHLLEYVDRFTEQRAQLDFVSTEQLQETREVLLVKLGQTLGGLVGQRNEVPIVVKTPSTKNISNVFSLFPNSRLIILYRDGRDTCHSLFNSGMAKSWKVAFETWASGVDEAIEFAGPPSKPALASERIMWIKYEDAIAEPRETCLKLAGFLGRGKKTINWPGLDEVKIYGSSEFGGGRKNWNWNLTEPTKNFEPVGRWRGWSRSRMHTFKRIANKQLIDLGYEDRENW